MKVLKKCDKCGKEIVKTKETDLEEISCPHCNRLYVFDKKTDRKITILIGVMIVILALGATFVQRKFEISFLIIIIPMIFAGLYARRFMTWFLFKINQLSYISAQEKE